MGKPGKEIGIGPKTHDFLSNSLHSTRFKVMLSSGTPCRRRGEMLP